MNKKLDLERVKELYIDQCISIKNIAKILNCSYKYLKGYIEAHSLERDLEKQKQLSKKRREDSCIKLFGVSSPLKNSEIKKKVQKTNLKKYGNICSLNNTEVNKKAKNTLNTNWNNGHPKRENLLHVENLNEEYVKNNFIKNQHFLLDDFVKYYNISYTHGRKLKRRWGIKVSNQLQQKSKEKAIFKWLETLNIETIHNDRTILKPYELDFWFPSKHLAIEFNGLMYHSFGSHRLEKFNTLEKESKEKYFHLFKTNECQKKGVDLLHIFENEWKDPLKKEIWKLLIQNKLGLNTKILSKDYNIQDLSIEQAREFLYKNSLEVKEFDLAKGIVHDQKIIAIMTFQKISNNRNWELTNFCYKLDYIIRKNILLELLNDFIKENNPSDIITIINRRWDTGKLQKNLGFYLHSTLPPKLFYFKEKDLTHLYSEEDMVEIQKENNFINPIENKYRRIYDSGYLVYKLSFNEIN